MIVKGITDECFTDYKKPVMYIAFPKCSFKCDQENECAMCQNSALAHEPDISINVSELITRYANNPITSGIVCGGLEPFDTPQDLLNLIIYAREKYCLKDPIIIYTGYTEDELKAGRLWNNLTMDTNEKYWKEIINFSNIIIKFGRFRPNQKPHYDEVLGINLASDNQYAKEYNYENIVE